MHFVRDCTELWNFFARLKIGQWNLHTLPQQAEGLRTVIKLRWISRSIRRAPTSSHFISLIDHYLLRCEVVSLQNWLESHFKKPRFPCFKHEKLDLTDL